MENLCEAGTVAASAQIAGAASTAPASPIRIVGALEYVNLAFPLVLGLGVCAWLSTGRRPSVEEVLVFDLVTKFLLFDVTHVVLTFFLLTGSPEGRALLRESRNQRASWTVIAPLLAGAVALVWFFHRLVLVQPWAMFALLFVPKIFQFVHASKQTMGLSLLYNRLAEPALAAEERAKIRRIEKRERFFFLGFVVVVLVVNLVQYAREYFPGFAPHFPIWYAVPVVVALLLGNTFLYRGPEWRNKKIFQLRILFYPFLGLFPFTRAAYAAVHGVEYVTLVMQMTGKSEMRRRTLWAALLPPLCLAFTLPLFFYHAPEQVSLVFGELRGAWSAVVIGLECFALALVFAHYYLDSVLFRLRDPAVRAHMGPLLGVPPR